VTHCCYDYDGTQKLGNVRQTPIAEIARSPFSRRSRRGFRTGDFSQLPALQGVLQEPRGQAALTDRLWRYAQAFPWKDPFRRFLNVPGGEN
jgi:hypothetical protein